MTRKTDTLFQNFIGRPVRATRLTPENAEALGRLDGLEYRPETDADEMTFLLRVEANYRQGVDFGDWIVEGTVPGTWIPMTAEDDDSVGWAAFETVYVPVAAE